MLTVVWFYVVWYVSSALCAVKGDHYVDLQTNIAYILLAKRRKNKLNFSALRTLPLGWCRISGAKDNLECLICKTRGRILNRYCPFRAWSSWNHALFTLASSGNVTFIEASLSRPRNEILSPTRSIIRPIWISLIQNGTTN